MQSYSVTWEIKLEAYSAEHAAHLAIGIMEHIRRASIARIFTICDDEGNVTRVDLQAEKEE